mmetsp:Transcript_71171/g.170449  ORF Transcript_71171/g.170449 Transcript_71171/m.170449 type:complete len:249 (+) Transcript_71171:799-1545(+)
MQRTIQHWGVEPRRYAQSWRGRWHAVGNRARPGSVWRHRLRTSTRKGSGRSLHYHRCFDRTPRWRHWWCLSAGTHQVWRSVWVRRPVSLHRRWRPRLPRCPLCHEGVLPQVPVVSDDDGGGWLARRHWRRRGIDLLLRRRRWRWRALPRGLVNRCALRASRSWRGSRARHCLVCGGGRCWWRSRAWRRRPCDLLCWWRSGIRRRSWRRRRGVSHLHLYLNVGSLSCARTSEWQRPAEAILLCWIRWPI